MCLSVPLCEDVFQRSDYGSSSLFAHSPWPHAIYTYSRECAATPSKRDGKWPTATSLFRSRTRLILIPEVEWPLFSYASLIYTFDIASSIFGGSFFALLRHTFSALELTFNNLISNDDMPTQIVSFFFFFFFF